MGVPVFGVPLNDFNLRSRFLFFFLRHFLKFPRADFTRVYDTLIWVVLEDGVE